MVIVLTFHSDDPSSNPADSFSVKFVFEKRENKQKEAGAGPFKNIMHYFSVENLNTLLGIVFLIWALQVNLVHALRS